MKTLLSDVLGPLDGAAAGRDAIVLLETAFGGDKTRNIITFYHVASGDGGKQFIQQFSSHSLLPL